MEGTDRLRDGMENAYREASRRSSRRAAGSRTAPQQLEATRWVAGALNEPVRPFILRPVATTAAPMMAIHCSGPDRLRFLPISALPKWTTRPSSGHPVPRCRPGDHDLVDHRAAGEPARADSGTQRDVFQQFGGASVITLQFSLRATSMSPSRSRAGDQRRAEPAAQRPAEPAGVQQGEPGETRNPDPGGDVRRRTCAAKIQDLVDTCNAEDLADLRGRPGQHRQQ